MTTAVARLRGWASNWRRRSLLAGSIFLLFWLAVGWYQTVKPLPSNLAFCGEPANFDGTDLRFLVDCTFRDAYDRPQHRQEIFDELFELIGGARRLVVLDLFLLNDHMGADGEAHRRLSEQLTTAIVAARNRVPEMPIVLVTDPINDVYGGDPSPQLAELRQVGAQVVVTDLMRLRDSNPAYSALWRLGLQWWKNSPDGGWLPNPLDAQGRKVGLRTYFRMANFKANHRKVALADAEDRWSAIIASANPHDASSAHSNVAIRVTGDAFAAQVYRAEMEVVRLSGGRPPFDRLPELGEAVDTGDHHAAYLTESAIRDRILELINSAKSGDEIDLALFYLSHREILEALLDAVRRNVWVRAILDPNRDAFGHEKPGIPNRQAAEYLRRESDGAIAMRWYATHGEQFHSKLMVVRSRDTVDAILGSANFTRRNLDNYNLEASVWIQAPRHTNIDREFKLYIDRMWTNDGGAYTLAYSAFQDTSRVRRFIARAQEVTGLGTF